jgi:PAS domain S-box-containing protein
VTLFWLDVGAYLLSAVLALVLTLLALGSAPRRWLSRYFACYTLSTAAFAALAALLRLSLWLERGDAELFGQLATFAFMLSGPALLLFAAHYVELSSRRVTAAAAAGFLWSCGFALPMALRGGLVYGHRLGANGTTHVQVTTLGVIGSLVPVAYLIWSLVLLWAYRRRAGESTMALSTVALLVGLIGGVLLDVPVPLLSFATLASLSILGYGILTVQLFNPLREHNLALQGEIAERQRAEGEILRLQHLLQAIADSMPSALITLDLEGRVLTWNPAAEALTGRPAGAMLGQQLWDACPELLRYRDLVEEVTLTHEAVCRTRDVVDDGDLTRYQQVEAFPLVSDGLTGLVLRIEDISRRVHFETLTLQAAKMVSVGQLAVGLAHELNNPLGAIVQGMQMVALMLDAGRDGSREQMEAAGMDPAALSRYAAARDLPLYMQEMNRAAERAARIVTDLLEFSQKREFAIKPHDLNALLRTTLELAAADYDLRKQYDFREIELVWDLAPDLPPIVCDAPQIQQAILNLVQNAGQAMATSAAAGAFLRAGEAYSPRLVLSTRQVGQVARLSIADNGPGLDPVVVERLCEPFVTTRDVGQGSGLGLWLCWSIVVEHHGGRIWLEQDDGGGACFVVELPIAESVAGVAVLADGARMPQ